MTEEEFVELLVSNSKDSLDDWLLQSPLHTQEERELITESIYDYLKYKK